MRARAAEQLGREVGAGRTSEQDGLAAARVDGGADRGEAQLVGPTEAGQETKTMRLV